MKKIRAKFECNSVILATEHYDAVAHLSAVYANSDGTVNEENKSFSAATPGGNVQISISKDVPAHKFFRAGRYYYLDFTRIPMTEQEVANDLYWHQQEKLKLKK
jgi:hypothetical protein